MAKRQSNTLFNYFQSPKTLKKEANSPASTPKSNTKVEENTAPTTPKAALNGKNKSDINDKDKSKETPKLVNSKNKNAKPASDSDDEVVIKRKRSMTSDDSSDSGNETPKKPILKKKNKLTKYWILMMRWKPQKVISKNSVLKRVHQKELKIQWTLLILLQKCSRKKK